MKEVDNFIKGSRAEFEGLLANLVRFPTVSMDPSRKSDINACAEYASIMLSANGWNSEIIKTAGNPVISADYISDPGYNTVLIYNHLDVQPANEDEWNNHPFQFVKDGDKYFGRGATDDKGPALTLFFAALLANKLRIPLNFQLLWEFEEEIGSPNFEEALKLARFETKADSVIVSDGLWVAENKPSAEYGLRGCVGFTMRIKTGGKDAHSGVTGGLARNPALELCEIISACCRKDGIVKIPHFYEKVRHTGEDEINRLFKNGFNREEFKKDYGLDVLRDMSDREAIKFIKTLPSFEVNGIKGGHQGEGIKTIVPCEAEAKISLRIVPDQTVGDIAKLITKFIKSLNDRVELYFEMGLEPYLADPKGPYFESLRMAVKKALRKECLLDRSGGSIGTVATMKRHLNVPIVQFGLSLPPHGYHAKNEYFEWKQYKNGVKVLTEYFKEISKLSA